MDTDSILGTTTGQGQAQGVGGAQDGEDCGLCGSSLVASTNNMVVAGHDSIVCSQLPIYIHNHCHCVPKMLKQRFHDVDASIVQGKWKASFLPCSQQIVSRLYSASPYPDGFVEILKQHTSSRVSEGLIRHVISSHECRRANCTSRGSIAIAGI